jgi:hypothetical protein
VPSWPLSRWVSRYCARLVVICASKSVHASYRRLLPLCARSPRRALPVVAAWPARRDCRQGPALLGRSRPRRAVDLSPWTAVAVAPLFGRCSSARRCRVAARSLNHIALPYLLRVCAASPRTWAPTACLS